MNVHSLLMMAFALLLPSPCAAFSICPLDGNPSFSKTRMMGLLDSMADFLQKRSGDFEKLEKSDRPFGPGPLILLVHVPTGISTAEIMDMVEDGAPTAFSQGVVLRRIESLEQENDGDLLDKSLQDALTIAADSKESVNDLEAMTIQAIDSTPKVPILFFSGFSNPEMMATYNILGQEIYQETGGRLSPACAKAVPNAMGKPLRQVLEEISGDHAEATSASTS